MEKRIWSKPEMNEFAFAANEYVAACGPSGQTYKFECNAEIEGNHTDIFGQKYDNLYYYSDARVNAAEPAPTNWDKMTATKLGKYHPCNDTHDAPVSEAYYWGFVDNNDDGKHDSSGSLIETVIVWIERGFFGNIRDAHATKELDINDWGRTPS